MNGHRWRQLTAGCLLLLVLCGWTGSSQALENIVTERWLAAHGIFYGTDDVSIGVLFDAHFTQMDLESGVAFSIVERDANGAPGAELFRFVLDGLQGLPPAGTPVKVHLQFNVMCNEEGRLVGSNASTFMSYCDPQTGTLYQRSSGVGSGFVRLSEASEVFSLALVDERGQLGPNPPALGDFWCTTRPLDVWFDPPLRALDRDLGIANDGASIGIYFDEAATECAGTIEADVPRDIYVVARLAGDTECGIAGAEFRFAGVPSGWVTIAEPYPNITTLGDPFGAGTVLGFPCESPREMVVPLFKVLMLADETRTDLQLTIEHRIPPTNPTVLQPFLVLCDAPVFSKTAVKGQPCWVNPSAAKDCTSLLPVEMGTWSRLKSFYR